MEGSHPLLRDHFPYLAGRKVMLAPGHVGYKGIGAKSIENVPYYSNDGSRDVTLDSAGYNEEQLNSYIVADTLAVLEHTFVTPRICVGPFYHKAAQAYAWQPDAFAEVHCNAAEDRDAHGFEIWTDNDPASVALAKAIGKRFLSYTPLKFRGLKNMESADNAGTWKDKHDALFKHMPLSERAFPLVLIECGFLSNPTDAAWLIDLSHHEKIAAAIVHGLNDFFRGE